MPSQGEKIKESVILSLLNIALPSVDVGSDIALLIKFYVGSRSNPYFHEEYKYDGYSYYNDSIINLTNTSHYTWGTMMLVPFMLNYLLCWYVWATTDKKKAFTWVPALLSFYPQYVALKIIYQIWWGDSKKGLQKKRHLERDLIQLETFTEAVPSTLVMTVLMARALDDADGAEIIFNPVNLESFDSVLFFVGFSSSIITSSLGLAKNLKVGPCRILPEQKTNLGGLLSPRFILIFFACGFTLVGKGVALAIAVYRTCTATDVGRSAATDLSTFFLPGLLIGLFSCWHQGILKTLVAHPSVFLLPVFTHFTFGSNSKLCCKGEVEGEKFISFSPKATAVNVSVTVAGILLYVITLPLVSALNYTAPLEDRCGSGFYLYLGLPCSLLGIILTLVVAFSNQCSCCEACCCSCERACCCFCCNSCCCEQFEFGALVTSSHGIPYILRPDGQLVKEGEADKGGDKGEVAETLEMEESKIVGVPSSPDVAPAETEVDKVIVREEVEKVEDQLELSVHRQGCSFHHQIVIWV